MHLLLHAFDRFDVIRAAFEVGRMFCIAVDAAGRCLFGYLLVDSTRALPRHVLFRALDAAVLVVAVSCRMAEQLAILTLCYSVLLFPFEYDALMQKKSLIEELFGITACF